LVSSLFIDGSYWTRLLSFWSLYMPVFPTAVALALREQVLDAGEVPVGANDVSVDMIVTPDETIAGTSE
jgi:5-formyltetrahydrofolate cyclo-ligase